jgi:hydroxypyruvate isomerase
MYRLAPNIDLLFSEAGEAHDRVRAAAAAGFDAVEMWGPTGKDIPALRDALAETGVAMVAQLAEPRMQFMIPPKHHKPFFTGLDAGVEVAQQLGCPRLVLGSGTGFGGRKRQDQLDELVEIFTKGVEHISGSGVTLVLEAVNIRVDHPGALLDRTGEAAYIARGVGSPDFGVLYDLYHSTVEGEDVDAELAAAADVIQYVQIADHPGRHEPGTGAIDWPARLAGLRSSGYDGPIGLEYYPATESAASVAYITSIAANA